MHVEYLGEETLILRDLAVPAYVAAEALRLRAWANVVDVVASYETVGVTFVGDIPQIAEIEEALAAPTSFSPRAHTIPVCYDGEDLAAVAAHLDMSADGISERHQSQPYQCFAVGFRPGFGYLGWLPDELSGIPRRPTPRPRVTGGSVAITGRQTAVYPMESPGGWAIIGRTPLVLVDVRDGYFPLRAGDTVHFESIDQREFDRLRGERL